MAANVTLADMIKSVRRRANIENQTNFITDPEITEYINAGLASLYDLLVQAGGQPWYRGTYTFSTVSNTDTYALPPDFYELQSVDIALSSGPNQQMISARPFMEYERNLYKYYPGWNYTTPVFYRLRDANVVFVPAPSGVFSIALNYYPVFIPLKDPGDSFDTINQWHEYAVWKAVADCRGKGDFDPSYAMSKAAELLPKIQSMSEQRDAGAPERMTETNSDYDGYYPGVSRGFP